MMARFVRMFSVKLAISVVAWLLLVSCSDPVLSFTLLPCDIPNESMRGYCIGAGVCRPYQQLKSSSSSSSSSDPEIAEFMRRLSCSQTGVCCSSKPTYANPRVHVEQTAHSTPQATLNYSIANCGFATTRDRIFGGDETQLDEFPWMALLFYQSEDTGELRPSCGGVLVSSRWVLTAAHCVKGRGYKSIGPLKFVRLGEHNLNTEVDCQGAGPDRYCSDAPVDIDVQEIIPHPDYVSTSWDKYNDVALLLLARDAPFTEFVRHVCLPGYFNMTERELAEARKLVVAGWGHTDYFKTVDSVPSPVMLKVAVPQVNNTECRSIYSRLSLRIDETQICAGGQKAKDSCRGDSGSPLMFYHRQHARWFTYGVVSRGPSSCGTEGVPSIYTNLFKFGDWVSRTMAANAV